MKKVRNIIIIAIIITAVAIAGFLAVKFMGDDNAEDVFVTEKTYASMEEMYLDNLIDSVSPDGSISVSPKEKILITVVAYSKAQVTVRVGTKRYDAKPADAENDGYTAFTVKVTMPKTREEIESIGTISVAAICGESSMQLSGAAVYPAEEMTNTTASQSATVLSAGNYVPDLPKDAYE